MSSGGVLLAAALAGLAFPVSSSSRLPPIDQCAAAPDFPAFRDDLQTAIRNRDNTALLALVADDVMVSFGAGGEGKQEFIATWDLNGPQASKLWDTLGKALELGCARSGNALVSPSMIAQADQAADGYKTFIAVVPGAVLRARPRDEAQIVARLDWDILTLADMDPGGDWLDVSLADGRKGFVRDDQVRSLIDYRAIFKQRAGRWWMTAFIAGD